MADAVHPAPARAYVALFLSLVLWASAYAGIRAGLRAYSPAHVALLRYATAAVVLTIYALLTRMRLPAARDLPALLVEAAVGISFYSIALSYGELTVTAGAASLLIASAPIWAAVLAAVFFGDRLSSAGYAGIIISFAGAALIAWGEGKGIHLSEHAFIILAASIASAIYTVLQKPLLRRYTAAEFTAYTMIGGAVLMLPFAGGLPGTIRTAPLAPTLSIIYLGIFPAAIAYWAYGYYLAHAPVTRAVSYLYLVPVFAIVIAWVWLREVPNALSLIGGAISLVGVVLVQVMGHRRLAAEPSSEIAEEPAPCPDV